MELIGLNFLISINSGPSKDKSPEHARIVARAAEFDGVYIHNENIRPSDGNVWQVWIGEQLEYIGMFHFPDQVKSAEFQDVLREMCGAVSAKRVQD